MSEAATQESPNAAQQPPAQASTERPQDQPPSLANESDAAPKGLRGAGLRYAADDPSIPDYARGKTADEVLALSQKVYNAAMSGSQATPPASPAPPPQMPATNVTNTNQPTLPDPQLQYSDPAAYQAALIAYNQATMQQQMQTFAAPMLAQQASFARAEARRNPRYTAIWEKYSGEIDAQMVNVPLQARTLEAWEMAAKIVAGDHLDELAQARAETLAAQGDSGTISGSEVPGRTAATAGDALSEMFRSNDPAVEKFRKIGYDAPKLIAHAAKMGHTPEAYATLLKRGTSVTVYETRGDSTEALLSV
jgi:hypothetical protein